MCLSMVPRFYKVRFNKAFGRRATNIEGDMEMTKIIPEQGDASPRRPWVYSAFA